MKEQKVALYLIIISILLSGLFYFFTKAKVIQTNGLKSKINNNQAIYLDLWIDYIMSSRKDLLQIGDTTNLIVRNRPHGQLKIIDKKCQPIEYSAYYIKYYGIEINKNNQLEPLLYQCRLVLADYNGQKTDNGYVSHGNPLKIGHKINIEGSMYNLSGAIVDLYQGKK